jgi:hypothetical protein
LRVSDHLWLWLFLLGAYHGINPGMGWLFAVALGLQERSARAVLRAVIPLTLGHVVSVSIVVLLAVLAALTFPHAIGIARPPACSSHSAFTVWSAYAIRDGLGCGLAFGVLRCGGC